MLGGGLLAQQEALATMGQVLADRLPRGYAMVVFNIVGITASYAEFETVYVRKDGTGIAVPGADNPQIAAALGLRQAMSHGGAWFGATFQYTDADGLHAQFNYDDEPLWARTPDPRVYMDDLASFPRQPSAIPAWLDERLQQATTR